MRERSPYRSVPQRGEVHASMRRAVTMHGTWCGKVEHMDRARAASAVTVSRSLQSGQGPLLPLSSLTVRLAFLALSSLAMRLTFLALTVIALSATTVAEVRAATQTCSFTFGQTFIVNGIPITFPTPTISADVQSTGSFQFTVPIAPQPIQCPQGGSVSVSGALTSSLTFSASGQTCGGTAT